MKFRPIAAGAACLALAAAAAAAPPPPGQRAPVPQPIELAPKPAPVSPPCRLLPAVDGAVHVAVTNVGGMVLAAGSHVQARFWSASGHFGSPTPSVLVRLPKPLRPGDTYRTSTSVARGDAVRCTSRRVDADAEFHFDPGPVIS